MLGGRVRRRHEARTSRPCRTGAPGRSRACPCRRLRPRAGSRSRSRRSGAAGPPPARISSSWSDGERDLRGADQVQVVVGEPVDLLLGIGQEPGPVQGPLAHEHRRHHRLEALAAERLEREADQRELEHHEVAAQVGEARAGQPRTPFHVDPVAGELQVVLAGGAGLPDLVRTRCPRRGVVRPAGSAATPAAYRARRGTAVSASLSSRPRAASAASCSRSSGVGGPLRPLAGAVLLGVELLERGADRTPSLIELEHSVDCGRRHLARAGGAPCGRRPDRGGSAGCRARVPPSALSHKYGGTPVAITASS